MYGVMDSLYKRNISAYTFRIVCLLMALILIGVLSKGKINISINQVIKMILAVCFFSLYILMTHNNVGSFLESLVVPFFVFFIISVIKGSEKIFKEYLSLYSNVVYILAIISLFFYFFGTVLNIIPGITMQYANNGEWNSGINYYFLSFVNNWQTQTIFGMTFIRNVGIFMEAPGYAFPLSISLYWELFNQIKIRKFRCLCLIATMITTFSTEALIMVAILGFMFIVTKKGNLFIERIKIIVCPLIIVGIVCFIYYVIITKMTGHNSDSYSIRLNDIYGALQTWLDYPCFGAGFYNTKAIYEHYIISKNFGNPTAGLLNVLAYGGLYSFFVYVFLFFKLLKYSFHVERKKSIQIFLGLVIFFLILEPYQYDFVILLILATIYSAPFKKIYANK